MSFWTAMVVIVAILSLTAARIARYNSRQRDSALSGPPVEDGEKILLRREVDDLRERIKVLERIATDANTSNALETRRVSDEIEALRDR